TPDLFPTLCDLLGLPTPASVESTSLVSLLQGSQGRVREHVYSAYKDVQRMVADERWKLIRYYRSPARQTGEDRLQLFDLEADPWELTDWSAEPAQAERVQQLAEALAGWQRWAGDPLAEVP